MITANRYGNLSESFRLTPREYGAIQFLRFNKRLNMEHIASLLGRSLATIHRVTDPLKKYASVDNRGQTVNQVNARRYQYTTSKSMVRLGVRLWLKGLVDSMQEAFDMRVIRRLVSESSGDEDDQDPA